MLYKRTVNPRTLKIAQKKREKKQAKLNKKEKDEEVRKKHKYKFKKDTELFLNWLVALVTNIRLSIYSYIPIFFYFLVKNPIFWTNFLYFLFFSFFKTIFLPCILQV